jgi:hypothetical protein
MIQILPGIIGSSNPLLIAATEAIATKRNWQLQNSSPTATIDQENKTHQKKKNKGPSSLTYTEKKTKKQKNKGPGSAWKLPGQTDKQTDTPVDLIYKMSMKCFPH